jgi:cysteine-rich repeat protein
VPACGDDDGGTSNQNQTNQNNGNDNLNNNNQAQPDCGDGAKNGTEACDGDDLGLTTCQSQGFPGGGTLSCTATCTVDTSGCVGQACGNGAVETGETCDDGNTADGDGCSAGCTVEAGWDCTGTPSVCAPVCGDQTIVGDEACDDGDTQGGDGCSAQCTVEAGWHCVGEPSQCVTECGDGIVAGAEACDEGSDNGVSPSPCTATCTLTTCGDGYVGGTEACDTTPPAGQDCTDLGYVDPAGIVCSGTCEVDTTGCGPTCGNGVVEPGEDCDDGAQVDGDGCSALCATEAGWTCHGTWCVPGVFVAIPAGTFTMGSPGDEPGRSSDETQHQVTLSQGFEMLSTEVTQGQFMAVLGYSPSYFSACGATCPVEQVNWHEAAAYANALSTRAGLGACYDCAGSGTTVTCGLAAAYATPYACPGYRLPTEAEWEYAARAGTITGTYNGTSTLLNCEQPNGVLDPIAWFCGNGGATTHAAGGKAANAWGLYDMLGNVWEWVHDWYATYPGDVSDPWGPAAGSVRVIRGGIFVNYAQYARAANRYGTDPSDRGSNLGFRPVRSSP